MTLSGDTSVTGNTAAYGGGMILDSGGSTLILNDSASVTGNTAIGVGGGISSGGTLTLNGSASVSGNAADEGGGIYASPYPPSRVYVCSDEVAIRPNDPNDPPKVRHVCP